MGVGVGSGRGAEAGKQRGIGSACHSIPSQDLPCPALHFAGTPIPTRNIREDVQKVTSTLNSISWGRGKEMRGDRDKARGESRQAQGWA